MQQLASQDIQTFIEKTNDEIVFEINQSKFNSYSIYQFTNMILINASTQKWLSLSIAIQYLTITNVIRGVTPGSF